MRLLLVYWLAFMTLPVRAEVCRLGELTTRTPTAATAEGRTWDAVDELVEIEVQQNLSSFRESPEPRDISTIDATRRSVRVMKTADAPSALVNFFVRGEKIRWPRHPYNMSSKVPFSKGHPNGAMTVQFTASRSLVFRVKGAGVFSLKLPTDKPHLSAPFPSKADNRADATYSVATTRYLDRLDKKLGSDPDLLILRDVLSIQDKKSENGFVVRDLTPLVTSGNRYVPAFSLPFIGHEIARKNRSEFAKFWKEHFAEPLGRAKAKLVLRYGVQMATPNAQNLLIELTPAGVPTGRIVLRDVVDTHWIRGVSENIATKAELGDTDFDDSLSPETHTSFWQMDLAGSPPLDWYTAIQWTQAHDLSYLKTLEEALGRSFRVDSFSQKGTVDIARSLDRATAFLKSQEGKRALEAYHASLAAHGNDERPLRAKQRRR